MSDRGPDAWKAPGSGTPLAPTEAACPPTVADIVSATVNKLMVPKGPMRTVSALIGGAINQGVGSIVANALNNPIRLELLGAPGIIDNMEVLAQLITTGAAAGFLQIFDVGDSNAPLIRSYPFNVGAAGSYNIAFSSSPKLPFLRGLYCTWTPITGAFGNSLIVVNIDFDSIPIGQRDA